MINNNLNHKYFYKLGHCPSLALAEFASLTDLNFTADHNFLLSSKLIDIQKTGSLIFSGEILHKIPSQSFFENNPLKNIQQVFDSKKIGLSLLTRKNLNQNLVLKTLKAQGYKKINLLANKTPTIGNFLSTKNWLILFDFQQEVVLAKITAFFDQELWSDLDQQLPIRDLKRGQINLKLARSLSNLTKQNTFWDPFCGIARNLISAMDIKTGFVASDIDKVAVSQAKQNYKFAVDFFLERGFKINLNQPVFFNKDITKSFAKLNLKLPKTVVTEGYLGKTFQKPPTITEIQQELEKIKEIWTSALFNLKELEIQEIVCCLPFYIYQKELILPEFIYTLAPIFGYKTEQIHPQHQNILYKRKTSKTGHLVLKLKNEL